MNKWKQHKVLWSLAAARGVCEVGAGGVCVTSIWEIENVGNSWKKSSAVLQILRGKSQPTPDVEMVDFEHMKCCGFNSCSQSAFFKLFGSYQGRNTFSLLKRDESWEQLSCTANSVCQSTKRRVLFIHFILMGWDRNSVILKILILQHLISMLLIK